MSKSATCVGSTCAGSYIKNSKFTTPAAPTATTEGLLAACVVGLPVRLTCMQQVDALDELLTRSWVDALAAYTLD